MLIMASLKKNAFEVDVHLLSFNIIVTHTINRKDFDELKTSNLNLHTFITLGKGEFSLGRGVQRVTPVIYSAIIYYMYTSKDSN